MFKYSYIVFPFLIVVSGCGGGPNDSISRIGADGFPIVAQKEFSFSSGTGVATATNQMGTSQEYNLAMVLLDETTSNKVADFMTVLYPENPDLVVHSSSSNGDFYEADLTATNANGEIGNTFFRGTILPSGAYVSYNSIEISGDYTFATDGTVLSGNLPSSVANYSGEAIIDDRGGSFDAEIGSFSMVADFSSNKADLDIAGATSFVSARFLDINRTQGRVDGVATMGVNGSPSISGTVLGFFAGESAEGVHGVVYGHTDEDATLDAMFFGAAQ